MEILDCAKEEYIKLITPTKSIKNPKIVNF